MHLIVNTTEDMSDVRLVEAARAGDSSAFDALVRRFQRAVHAVAFAVLSDREVALDILQESFIAAYHQLHDLNDPARFGPWVCAIARNKARQHRRDLGRRRLRELPYTEVGENVSRSAPYIDEVREALGSLTKAQADAVALFYMEGYSITECAGLLGVPQGTVKRRLHDARQRLKKEMIAMIEEHLSEFALPEDYRVVIDKPSRIMSNRTTLAWFRGRWVMVWQDGIMWGKERWMCNHFEFWLSESADGKQWSEPRKLEFNYYPKDHVFYFHLKQIHVMGDRLYIHTYGHGDGIDLHSSEDLINWTSYPRARPMGVGRGAIFSVNDELFLTSPAWVAIEPYCGDRVDLMKSSDGGCTWQWLESPSWPRHGVTDSVGIAVDNRIYITWLEWSGPEENRTNQTCINWSDDGARSWSTPVLIEPLTLTNRASWKQELLSVGDVLVVAQEVWDEKGSGESEVWLALSRDGGATWQQKAVYSAGSLLDPGIAVNPEGTLLIVGSSRTGDGARPWVVHTHIDI